MLTNEQIEDYLVGNFSPAAAAAAGVFQVVMASYNSPFFIALKSLNGNLAKNRSILSRILEGLIRF